MKVKEVEVTANVAWSPSEQVPILLAGGTAAQQLDATFDTASALEIFSLNLSESGHGMPKVASVPVDNRFHKLVWGPGADTSGLIIGGMDRGFVNVYSASKLIKGQDSPLLFSKAKHTSPVSALDVNPFQQNLLASGGSESEIFIWDLNKSQQSPMTPGAKSQPLEDVRCVAWNRQVQHILGSTFSSRCVVWDLRKNEPIIKVSDSTSRMRCKVVAWHPDVATQLCLASEDDHTPVIQIWDLRLASSPIRTLEHHQRGILSVAWCKQDPDLLLSCGKDNKILCWNPNSGEVVCELATSNQWSFDVAWCPRNPAVISSASFDGRVSIYSLMGGQQQAEPTSSIADSFPGMEAMQPVTARQVQPAVQLKNPPRWLRRPCGASFGFGGKLVTFEALPAQQQQQQQQQHPGQQQQQQSVTVQKSQVKLGSVVTEEELVQRSLRLETSLQHDNMAEFCELKISSSAVTDDQQVWRFIRANFEQDSRTSLLDLLGYEPEKVSQLIGEKAGIKKKSNVVTADEITEGIGSISTCDDAFEVIAAHEKVEAKKQEPFGICTDEESGSGMLSKALLTGNLEQAVDLCLQQDRMADAIILAIQGGPDLMERTQQKYFDQSQSKEAPLISAVVSGDWTDVIKYVHASNWKEALAAALAYSQPQEFPGLCSRLGTRLMEANMKQEALLCFVCARNLDQVVSCWMNTRDVGSGPGPLQDLVEVVMTLKTSAERLTGQAVDIKTGPLATKLTQYASLLAAQGALTAALSYLGHSNEEAINQLRDRLNGAIGQSASRSSAPRQQAQTSNNQMSRGGVGQRRSGWPSGGSGGGGGSAYAPHGADQYTAYTGIHNPAVEDLSTFTPAIPHFHHDGITERRNSRPHNPAVEGPYHHHGSGSYGGDNYNQRRTSMERMVPHQQPAATVNNPVNVFTPDFSQQHSPMGGPPPPGAHNAFMRDRTASESSNHSTAYDHGPPISSGPGWNDPPQAALSLARSKAAATTTTVAAVTQPITQPLAQGPEPVQQGPPSMMMMQQQQPSYGYQQQQQQGYEQQPPANMMQPSYTGFQPQQEVASVPQAPQKQATPEPPVPAGPLPAEHQVLQDVFDGLRERCVTAANHPQIRRKLMDVGKKLEVLYDRLRNNTLPPATVTGLHQMVQYIWAYDYNSCLLVVNQLVSSGSFSILAEFLPGIKVLIQVASQLGVYVERPQH